MAFFADSDQLYACARALFSRLQADAPTAVQGVQTSRLLIHLRCSDPSAEITLNGRQRPVQISYGPIRLRPDLTVDLKADTLHGILADELSLKKALANGQLKVQGPIWKATVLGDLFTQGRVFYPQILREQGLDK